VHDLTAKPDRALVLGVNTAEDLYKSALAGTVLSGKDMNFARPHFQTSIPEDRDAAE
jgi:hypothetical protein